MLTGDSSSVLCSQPKRGALRRQARVEQHNQEQLQDPWVRLSDSSPEELPEIHHQHTPDNKQPVVNVHSKPANMSDEENATEINGTATDVTSDPQPDTTPENSSEAPSESKKGPPVAPKPIWFRQSLRKIRDEQDQKKRVKPAEPRPAVGFRSFGARSASSGANLSIKQKIHSFETFSTPEDPEKVGSRRPVAPSTSLPLMEKESRSHPSPSHEDCGNRKHEIPKEIQSNQSASVQETDNTITAITSTRPETCEDDPPSIQTPADPPASDTISSDLDSEINDSHSAPAHDDNVLPSKQESELERADLSDPVTSPRSNQDEGESRPEGTEEEGEPRQGNLQSTTMSAGPPADSNSRERGLEGESLGKILAFSNQVICHVRSCGSDPKKHLKLHFVRYPKLISLFVDITHISGNVRA